jgi:predicted transposase/invertase (TIGR01784 family)
VKILNPYQLPHLEGLKEPILDVSCRDNRDIEYIVEMQVFYTSAFDKRILYYTSKRYVEQLEKGDEFPQLNQVIFIGILDFLLFKEKEEYKSIHKIIDLQTREIFFKDFVFILIELPKFNLDLHDLKTVEEKWFYFIKNARNLEVEPDILRSETAIHEALCLAEKVKWSKEEFDLYIKRGIYIQDERGRIEQGVNKGRLEGEKVGLEKGLIQGEKIGMEKGLIQGEKIGMEKGLVQGEKIRREEIKLELAKNLLDVLDIDTIAQKTGLTKEIIEKLKKEQLHK